MQMNRNLLIVLASLALLIIAILTLRTPSQPTPPPIPGDSLTAPVEPLQGGAPLSKQPPAQQQPAANEPGYVPTLPPVTAPKTMEVPDPAAMGAAPAAPGSMPADTTTKEISGSMAAPPEVEGNSAGSATPEGLSDMPATEGGSAPATGDPQNR